MHPHLQLQEKTKLPLYLYELLIWLCILQYYTIQQHRDSSTNFPSLPSDHLHWTDV